MTGASIPPDVPVSYRRQYRRCGKPACSRCTGGGPGHGPYWYAFWREAGRSCSRYLGKQAPAGARVLTISEAHEGAVAAAPHEDGVADLPRPAGRRLRVRTLGTFAVWRGGTPIPPEAWTSRRALTLFKCLLSTPGHRLHRGQAGELLWPEADPASSATNLRTTTHLLRQILDGPGAVERHLHTEGGMLALVPTAGARSEENWLDATAFAAAARTALAGSDVLACREALAWYGGEYLSEDPYEAWAAQPRASLRQLHLELLLHSATLSATGGDLRGAEDCLRRVLSVEPTHEGAAATLMAILAASGRRGEALQLYQQLAAVLEEELDVVPNAEIMALRARLQHQDAAPPASSIAPPDVRTQRPTNLPLALTSFVGRVWEVRAIVEALATARLLTLTGPGGVGKTRLALAVAESLVEEYSEGVWLVELAALAEPMLVPYTVATALGVTEQAGRAMRDTLADFLRPRRLLLVLDNCEHLAVGCAELATALLRACPLLRLLATSREGLEVAGERTYRVPSLAVPDSERLPPLEQVSANEAVRLFVERAQSHRPEIRLTATNVGAVAQICARLDGLPLAIELAAARVGTMSIEGIAARLTDRFRLLTGGPRTAMPRQQTMRATLDWSYWLLDAAERVLWRRLAVFAGGCTLEAAEAVCAGPEIEASEIMDLLRSLVNKSLVLLEAADSAAEPGRYRLLETMRQYGQEQLAAAEEMTTVRERHLAWGLALAEEAEPYLIEREQGPWFAQLEVEHLNLQAALRWSIQEGSAVQLGARLAAALGRFWAHFGHISVAHCWLEPVATSEEVAPATQVKALYWLAVQAGHDGDFRRAGRFFEKSLVLARGLGAGRGIARALNGLASMVDDPRKAVALLAEAKAVSAQSGYSRGVATALGHLGVIALHCGDYRGAAEQFEESLILDRERGDRREIAISLYQLGLVALYQGDYARARRLLDEGHCLLREIGNTTDLLFLLQGLGILAHLKGEYQRATGLFEQILARAHEQGSRWHTIYALLGLALQAREQFNLERACALQEESLVLAKELEDPLPLGEVVSALGLTAIFQRDHRRAEILLTEGLRTHREQGFTPGIATFLHHLGRLAHKEDDPKQAQALYVESLTLRQGMGEKLGIAECLEGLGLVAPGLGRPVQAVRFLASAQALREAIGAPLPSGERSTQQLAQAALRATLGERAFTAAWAAGWVLPLQKAIAEAQEEDMRA